LLCILDDIPRVAAGICSVVCVIENSNGTYCILLYVKVKKTWKVQKIIPGIKPCRQLILKLKMVDFKKFGEMKIVNSKIEPTSSYPFRI
jgi:hypothetical protein